MRPGAPATAGAASRRAVPAAIGGVEARTDGRRAPTFRPPFRLEGPFTIGRGDIAPLNLLFSETFTERYRRDGLVGVRVPPLNPAIWRTRSRTRARAQCCGATRAARSRRSTSRIAPESKDGWGRSRCATTARDRGSGKLIVNAGVELLKRSGCGVIGLETMPRTMDNIGFYSGLGFVPARLTVTLTVDAVALSQRSAPPVGAATPGRATAPSASARRSCDEAAARDSTTRREIELTNELRSATRS